MLELGLYLLGAICITIGVYFILKKIYRVNNFEQVAQKFL
jgi:hypothetical protein